MNREFPFRRQLAQCSCQVDILRALRSPLASNHKYVINVVLYVHNRTRLNLPPSLKKDFALLDDTNAYFQSHRFHSCL